MAAGAFTPPDAGTGRGPNPYKTLGPFCRVAATLTPTSDSDIKIEVWLPSPRAEGAPGNTGWDGEDVARGNGGLGRGHQLFRDGRSVTARLRHGVHRHGARRRARHLRTGPSGEARRLRVAV